MMNSKLLLFDIDGTLLTAHGVPRKAMARVLTKRYKNFEYDHNYDFSGRTDPEIIEHLLSYDKRSFSQELIKEILDEFCIELEIEISNGQKPILHPGVKELIEELENIDNIYLGLVTGNVSAGAYIKLEAAGLHSSFPVGGFGDDSKIRNDLPPIARKRAESHFKKKFNLPDIWIIGDSVYDVECAQKNDLRCLAVSTGKTPKEKLAAANPEILVDDFSDIEKIKEILIYR
jgi:phosphoglycolate phosphatase-like HAD superfamily hydrolase